MGGTCNTGMHTCFNEVLVFGPDHQKMEREESVEGWTADGSDGRVAQGGVH